jgi:hypothetical protein
MFGLKSLAAAAAATALAVASPALAATMVFDINVTSATGVSGFTPTSFQETFTLGAATLSSSTEITGPVSGSTPLTAGLQSLVDLTGATDYSNYFLAIDSPPPGFPFPPSVEGDLYENLSAGASGSYQQSIDGGSSLAVPGSVDAAGLAAFFTSQGALPWYEQVSGSDYALLASYSGTATLVSFTDVSAAPEPASWALMLLGVGGLGAMLRRRGRAVLA